MIDQAKDLELSANELEAVKWMIEEEKEGEQ